jgi:DNA-binding winged helix-turn-helix (wHTH) protein
MSNITKGFQFAEFHLDTAEQTLERDGSRVSITPKAFQLLAMLVENAGNTVKKERIMETIWCNSFVEDGNLAFTIRLIRIALADDARVPRFIETIPRRGYRFIAEVTPIDDIPEPSLAKIEPAHVAGEAFPGTAPPRRSFPRRLIAFAFVSALGLSVAAFWYATDESAAVTSFTRLDRLSWSDLSTNGMTSHALLSPDGKNVIYVNSSGGKTEYLDPAACVR